AEVLAAVGCVDAVVTFEEDTPQDLIEAILPDVLVKGGDYQVDHVVGRDVVESHGGRLVLIPLVAGYSTTGVARRLAERHVSIHPPEATPRSPTSGRPMPKGTRQTNYSGSPTRRTPAEASESTPPNPPL